MLAFGVSLLSILISICIVLGEEELATAEMANENMGFQYFFLRCSGLGLED
jgi:hypothetical protein